MSKTPFVNIFPRKAYENMLAERNMITKGHPNKTEGRPYGRFCFGNLMLTFIIYGTGEDFSPVYIRPLLYAINSRIRGSEYRLTEKGEEFTLIDICEEAGNPMNIEITDHQPLLHLSYDYWFHDLEAWTEKPSYEDFVKKAEKFLTTIVESNYGFETDKTDKWTPFEFRVNPSDCFTRNNLGNKDVYVSVCGFCVPDGATLKFKSREGSDLPPLSVRVRKAEYDDPFMITVKDILAGMYENGYERVYPADYDYIAQRSDCDNDSFSLYCKVLSRDYKNETVSIRAGVVYGKLTKEHRTMSTADFEEYYVPFSEHPCTYIPRYIGTVCGHYERYSDIPEHTKVYAVEVPSLEKLTSGEFGPRIYPGEISAPDFGAPLTGFYAYSNESAGVLSKERQSVANFEFFTDPDAAYAYAENETRKLVGELMKSIDAYYETYPTYNTYKKSH